MDRGALVRRAGPVLRRPRRDPHGPRARGPALFQVTQGPGAWRVRQVLDEAEGDHDWRIEAVVDLAASDEVGEIRLRIAVVGAL